MFTQTSERGFATVGIIAVVVVGSIIAGIIITAEPQEPTAPEGFLEEVVMEDAVNTDDRMENDTHSGDTMMKDDPKLEMMDDEELAADGSLDGYLLVDKDVEIDTTFLPESQPGEFIEYADGTLAYAETGDVVIFFHADWCPSCRGLEKDINANLSAIPDGLSIQKVDYDTATALKKKYGVVRQHTLVQVDASGNKLQTLTGLTNTLSQVAAQL